MDQAETLRIQAHWKKLLEQSNPITISAAVPFYASQEGRVTSCGSGVLLAVGERKFILTAAHVLDFQEIMKLPLAIGSPTKGDFLTPLETLNIYRSPYKLKLKIKENYSELRKQESDPIDTGIVEITPGMAAELEKSKRFSSLREVDVETPYVPGAFLIAGYPLKKSKVDATAKTVTFEGGWFVTNLADPPVREDGLALHFTYPSSGINLRGEELNLDHPEGISGCGVWRIGDLRSIQMNGGNWTADHVKLIGIEHGWYEESRRVHATPIHIAVQMIYKGYPDLREIMDQELGRITRAWQE